MCPVPYGPGLRRLWPIFRVPILVVNAEIDGHLDARGRFSFVVGNGNVRDETTDR